MAKNPFAKMPGMASPGGNPFAKLPSGVKPGVKGGAGLKADKNTGKPEGSKADLKAEALLRLKPKKKK